MPSRSRVWAVVVGLMLLGGAVVTGTTGAGASGGRNPYPRDDELTISDVQMLGTHNSFHVRPGDDLAPTDPANYEHAPLEVQLEDQGIRSFELDAYSAPTFPVFHSLITDARSTCATLEQCLREISTWSGDHRGHVPMIVLIEPKALPVNANPAIQALIDAEVARQQLTSWDAAAYDRLDDLVREVFGASLLTPDDVRGKRPTLRQAVLKDGWPTLAATRGSVLVVLNASGPGRDLYLAGARSLEGRAMFVPSDVAEPSAAFVKRDVPLPAAIPRIVGRGFLVRTRADADGEEARAGDLSRATLALDSGATVVSTDYPVADAAVGPYVVRLPGTAVARCNPVTAPRSCRDTDIENARGLRNP